MRGPSYPVRVPRSQDYPRSQQGCRRYCRPEVIDKHPREPQAFDDRRRHRLVFPVVWKWPHFLLFQPSVRDHRHHRSNNPAPHQRSPPDLGPRMGCLCRRTGRTYRTKGSFHFLLR